MKLGTVAYSNKIYNLDYMTLDEMQVLLKTIEQDKKESFKEAKKVIKNNNKKSKKEEQKANN